MFEHPQLATLRERKKALVEESTQMRDEIIAELPPIIKLAKWVDLGVRATKLIRSFMSGSFSMILMAGTGVVASLFLKAASTKESTNNVLGKLLSASNYLTWGWQAYHRLKQTWGFLRSSGFASQKSQVAP